MHLLIAWLAVRLAWGRESNDADQTGALQTVADGPAGHAVLWTIGLGMLALALWQAGEVLLWWHGLLEKEHRVRTALVIAKCLAKALVYAVIGVTALLFAVGLEYEADERLQDLTDDTLEIPGGTALVVVVAIGVIAIGLYTLVRGHHRRVHARHRPARRPRPLGAADRARRPGRVRREGDRVRAGRRPAVAGGRRPPTSPAPRVWTAP